MRLPGTYSRSATAGGLGQAEVHRAGAPERDLRPPHHRADFEAVAGQEPFCREHAEGVEVVVALSLAAAPPARALQPLHEGVAAAEQRLVPRVQRPLPLARRVEAPDLVHRPAQAAAQAGDDGFQAVREPLDVGRAAPEVAVTPGVASGPALLEHPPHVRSQSIRVAPHEIAQRIEVERHGPHLAVLEQVGLHPPRQAAVRGRPGSRCAPSRFGAGFPREPDGGERPESPDVPPHPGMSFPSGAARRGNVLDLLPLRPPAGRAPSPSRQSRVQARDDRRVDVLGDHHLVAQVEGRRGRSGPRASFGGSAK